MDEPKCNHPKACWSTDYDGITCGWCEEVKRIQSDRDQLRNQLDGQAIIVQGDAEVHLHCNKIGYLVHRSGTIHMHEGFDTAKQIKMVVAI